MGASQYHYFHNLDNKRILLRVDLNVPLKEGIIQDETRINKILPVINFLLEKNCSVKDQIIWERPLPCKNTIVSLELSTPCPASEA